MSKKDQSDPFGSEGHRLIAELQSHLKFDTPLPQESAEIWNVCLAGLYTAKNQEEAAEYLFRLLKLEYKTGRRTGRTEFLVFRVEWLALDLGSKTAAFKQIEEDGNKEYQSIRNSYYTYRKKHPGHGESIQWYAQHLRDQGHSINNHNSLVLLLALCDQKNL